MELRRLGADGPEVSLLGLGCNNFGMRLGREESAAVLEAALDAGITHLDTAAMYGRGSSETFIGETLGSRRDQVVIATKFSPRPEDMPYEPGVLARWIRTSCEDSLRRLRTDRIDLYYQHFPDAEAPVDEAVEALGELRREGKIVHIASSNVSADQLTQAAKVAEQRSLPRFCATQIEWNLLAREVEAELVPAARQHGMGIVPFYPLAAGMLTGKYRRGETYPAGSRFDTMGFFADKVVNDENFGRVDALTTFAQDRGHSLLELAVAWLAAQPGVASVIAGATSPAQIEANVAATRWRLTDEDLAAIP